LILSRRYEINSSYLLGVFPLKYAVAVAVYLFAAHAAAATLVDVSLNGDSVACSQLLSDVKTHLQFELVNVQSQHEAGQVYSGTLSLTKDFVLSPDDWTQEHSFSSIRLSINDPYPHILHTTAEPSLLNFFFGSASDAIAFKKMFFT